MARSKKRKKDNFLGAEKAKDRERMMVLVSEFHHDFRMVVVEKNSGTLNMGKRPGWAVQPFKPYID